MGENKSNSIPPHQASAEVVDVLLLGTGWTATFLIPLLESESLSYRSTSRNGSSNTIPFLFDPDSRDPAPYLRLPHATTVVIIFPLKNTGPSKTLVEMYNQNHTPKKAKFIQLGSTGIWPEVSGLIDRHKTPDLTEPRAIAENELLELGGAVLNLAGLWGGARHPRNWVRRVAQTKKALAEKKTLHLVHGIDVAWAIVTLVRGFTPGQRWIVTDLRVYDWWDLASRWGDGGSDSLEIKGDQPGWVLELMEENGIKTLPRNTENLRRLDSFELWKMARRVPVKVLDILTP